TVKHTAPPAAMQDYIQAGPVDATDLPEYVDKFLDTPEAGETVSRKQAMYDLWRKRYSVDATQKENLCSLLDEPHSKKTLFSLHKRILLLWSLHTYIQDMDKSLLALLKEVRYPVDSSSGPGGGKDLESLGLDAHAIEAARLLKIEPQVAALLALNKDNVQSNDRSRQQLELIVLERI